MQERVFFAANRTGALGFAAAQLERMGQTVAGTPSPAVTHLLLPAPAFTPDGEIRGGGMLCEILRDLPQAVTIIGGGLDRPELAGYERWDLLKDEGYLAKNAAITAHCALATAMETLPVTLDGCPVLVLGWGRIGKILAKLLSNLGADVTVTSRSPKNRAMLAALNYGAEDPAQLSYILGRYRLIFNTAPAPVLTEDQIVHCRPDCVKIDLASRPGIAGADVIHARGLPGKDAPESSGKLICRTILGLCAQREGKL